jgi:hypothetical protein
MELNLITQADSGGKVNVLEDYSSLKKKRIDMNMCLILNGYQDRTVWIYKYKNSVNGNRQREITYC